MADRVICEAGTSQSHLRKCRKCGNHGKSKVYPRTIHEDPEREWRYGCTLSLTSAPNGVRGQRHAPAALPFGGKKPGTNFTRGWVGPIASLDEYGECRLRRDSIPGPSSP